MSLKRKKKEKNKNLHHQTKVSLERAEKTEKVVMEATQKESNL